MKVLKRINKLLPIIFAGIFWGVMWYFVDNEIFHAALIAIIWMDKQTIAKEVKELRRHSI